MTQYLPPSHARPEKDGIARRLRDPILERSKNCTPQHPQPTQSALNYFSNTPNHICTLTFTKVLLHQMLLHDSSPLLHSYIHPLNGNYSPYRNSSTAKSLTHCCYKCGPTLKPIPCSTRQIPSHLEMLAGPGTPFLSTLELAPPNLSRLHKSIHTTFLLYVTTFPLLF
jgi:hypothetical protein